MFYYNMNNDDLSENIVLKEIDEGDVIVTVALPEVHLVFLKKNFSIDEGIEKLRSLTISERSKKPVCTRPLSE